MADDNDKKAFIRIEREENTVKYIAKVFSEAPRQITKAQYNAIVKALKDQDWRTNEEDENVVINQIITRNLTVAAEPEKSEDNLP